MKAVLILVLLSGGQIETTHPRPLADCIGWAKLYTGMAETRATQRTPAAQEIIGAYCKVVKP